MRLQVVIDPDVQLERMYLKNKIHSNAGQDAIAFARQQESCWRISKDDHDFLMEEAMSRADYEFECNILEEEEPHPDLEDENEEDLHPDDREGSNDDGNSSDND